MIPIRGTPRVALVPWGWGHHWGQCSHVAAQWPDACGGPWDGKQHPEHRALGAPGSGGGKFGGGPGIRSQGSREEWGGLCELHFAVGLVDFRLPAREVLEFRLCCQLDGPTRQVRRSEGGHFSLLLTENI